MKKAIKALNETSARLSKAAQRLERAKEMLRLAREKEAKSDERQRQAFAQANASFTRFNNAVQEVQPVLYRLNGKSFDAQKDTWTWEDGKFSNTIEVVNTTAQA